jgi:glutamate-ammonia-ligase adenylyltransferase
VLTETHLADAERDYRAILQDAVNSEGNYGAELAALRQAWSRLIIEIGALDINGRISLREGNRRQTLLAESSIDTAIAIARRELERRYGPFEVEPRLAVLGLGRLGGRGMDYGSDLDVVLVYDDSGASPISRLTLADVYARFTELIVSALSSLTREGYLYRVDLRLRPDGMNGPTCSGATAFIEYLRSRSAPWEWLAYVKLRAAGGDRDLAIQTETEARSVIHNTARSADAQMLLMETRRVRERLEIEKTKRNARAIDVKYGPGGMLDVYFATRFLQLRDGVPDLPEDRSTTSTLARLFAAGSLNEEDYTVMRDGYSMLRNLDHLLRLTIGRSTRLPAPDHPAVRDIAVKLGFSSAADLLERLEVSMTSIRQSYERVAG